MGGGGHSFLVPSSLFALTAHLSPPSQAHNDLLQTYEAKLMSFGIPLDNLGFKPLETSLLGHTLGQGPAGFVSTPT